MMALLKGAKRKSTFLNKIQYGDLIPLNLEDQLSVFVGTCGFSALVKHIFGIYTMCIYTKHIQFHQLMEIHFCKFSFLNNFRIISLAQHFDSFQMGAHENFTPFNLKRR
jgi:hypothetical protein